MKQIQIDFLPENIELIYDGRKTSTLRTPKQAEKIDLQPGEKGLMQVKDRQFVVENKGYVMVDEVGGKDVIWRSEGFLHTSPKFLTTWYFLNGIRQLHFYTISPE